MFRRKTILAVITILGCLALAGTNALRTSGDTGSTVTVSITSTQFFAGSYHTVLNITNVDSPQQVEVLVLNSTSGEPIYNYLTGNSGWVAYLNGTVLTYEAYDGNRIHYGLSKGDSMSILTVLALNTGFPVNWTAYTKQGPGDNDKYVLLDQGTIML